LLSGELLRGELDGFRKSLDEDGSDNLTEGGTHVRNYAILCHHSWSKKSSLNVTMVPSL